jgi:hypothetical protein
MKDRELRPPMEWLATVMFEVRCEDSFWPHPACG